MVLNEKDGVLFYQFPNLSEFPRIFHGIFTRNSGCSRPPYGSLNVSFSVGDDNDCVKRNREIISEVSDGLRLVFLNQVHGTEVVVFKKDDMEFIEVGMKTAHVGDAMVTDMRQIGLVVKLADCQSVLLYDPEQQVVANIHCGWRGSINNIIGRTIHTMTHTFGSHPSNIQAGIGPSLGPCCAEFVNYLQEIPQDLWEYKIGSNYFNFWAISFDQLTQSGVSAGNICLSRICSKCHTDQFFSYRGEGITGRFAAVIALG